MKEETNKHYIQRMTNTKGKIFTPDGWISVQNYKYRNKKMLCLSCYTDCIYKAGQPIAKLWMTPTDSVHLACQLLKASQIWNKQKRKSQMKCCDNCRREVENLNAYFELFLCDACYAEQKNNDRINARGDKK